MDTTVKKNQQQEEECLLCKRAKLPPPRISAIAGRRPTRKSIVKNNFTTYEAIPSKEPLIIPFKAIKEIPGGELGRGSYGRVFEVECEKINYAAKEVHSTLLNDHGQCQGFASVKASFIRECHIWSQLSHPCIVQFIGMYYPAKDKLPVIVMEKMQHTLREITQMQSKLSFDKTGIILNDVCLGLQYLHTRLPPIIHRDLTPNNILLCYHYRAKISDLGVARTLRANDTRMTRTPGTLDFMAPECLLDNPEYGLPLDIFSFGGVILYMAAHQWPHPTPWITFDCITDKKIVHTSEVHRRQQYIDKITGPHTSLIPLMISCLDDNPKNRPIVGKVLAELKEVNKTGEKCEVYVDPWKENPQSMQQLEKQLEQNQQQCQKQQQKQENQQTHEKLRQQLQHQKSKEELQQISMQSVTTDEKQLETPTSENMSLMNESLVALDLQTTSISSPPRKSEPLFVACRDFSSEKDAHLNFKKGDLLYILNRDNKIWWYARAKDSGQEGYIPVNYAIRLSVSKPVPKVLDHPMYMGKYDFSSEDDRYLSFKKGDLMYVLNTIEGDWWFAKSKHTGQEGYVPNSYIVEINTLDAQDWFFGAVTRKHAENLLMQPFNESGSFLIRNSESAPGEYSLSVKYAGRVRHYKIKRNSKGYYIMNTTFENIPELVKHYSENPVDQCFTLKNACLSERTNETWEIERNSIHLVKKLGGGKFGEVWQGTWNDTTEVAVKILKPGTISGNEFFEEVALTKQLRHPKLVQLYGVCTKKEPIYIITDMMKRGSLLTYLRGDGRSLKFPKLIDMGAQVASGMAYLEEKNYVHRDLAARNILVSENLNCKVESVSMARILSEDIYEAYTGAKFPIKWTAPEALFHHQFTIKSDVWSFGILLYELITYGRYPYPGKSNAEVLKLLQDGYRMAPPASCPELLYKIMEECWRGDAVSRPTFESLHWRMEDYFTESEPTHLHLHQPSNQKQLPKGTANSVKFPSLATTSALTKSRHVSSDILVKAPESDLTYPLFIGKYNYSSRTDNDLGFEKGELLYIIDKTEGDWWLARSKDTGQEGYIPNKYIAEFKSLDAEEHTICLVKNTEHCPLINSHVVAKYFDAEGGKLLIRRYAVAITVPKGAVADGDKVQIEAAASLIGPYIIPEGYHPVSAYVWIGASYTFKRQVQVQIEHHAVLSRPEDISQMSIILTACCKDRVINKDMYEMHEKVTQFTIRESVCIYSTDHFCSNCLAKKENDKIPYKIPDRIVAYHMLSESYESADYFTSEICFCYNLKVCEKTVEGRYKERKMTKKSSCVIHKIDTTSRDVQTLHLSLPGPNSVDGWDVFYEHRNEVPYSGKF